VFLQLQQQLRCSIAATLQLMVEGTS
jgi:hypothetical protein